MLNHTQFLAFGELVNRVRIYREFRAGVAARDPRIIQLP